jgi:RNA polymerase sigma-70 factor (ECF subfamily)
VAASQDECVPDPSGLKAEDSRADVPLVARITKADRIGESFEGVLGAAREGADWAVAVLFRALQPRLLRFLRAQAPQDAEDIASQAWLEVARSLPRFEGDEDDFCALVFTVARRRLFDHRRANRRRPVTLDGDGTFATIADPLRMEDDVISGIRGEEAARRIHALLPSDQAEIVLLRVVGGLSVDEVARLVGRRPGTVRVLQHRALKRLAQKLGDNL